MEAEMAGIELGDSGDNQWKNLDLFWSLICQVFMPLAIVFVVELVLVLANFGRAASEASKYVAALPSDQSEAVKERDRERLLRKWEALKGELDRALRVQEFGGDYTKVRTQSGFPDDRLFAEQARNARDFGFNRPLELQRELYKRTLKYRIEGVPDFFDPQFLGDGLPGQKVLVVCDEDRQYLLDRIKQACSDWYKAIDGLQNKAIVSVLKNDHWNEVVADRDLEKYHRNTAGLFLSKGIPLLRFAHYANNNN